MDNPTRVELGFENVDAVKIPVDGVSVRLEGVSKTIDMSSGQYSENLVCDFASIRIPCKYLQNKTSMGENTLEDHIQFQDFVDVAITSKYDSGVDVYLPWVDGQDEQTNIAQHTYQEDGIFGKPIKGYSGKYKGYDVVLFFFDEKLHPEYIERLNRYEGNTTVGYTYDGEDGWEDAWPDEDVEGRYDDTYDDDDELEEDNDTSSSESYHDNYSDAIKLINKVLDELTKKSWKLGDK